MIEGSGPKLEDLPSIEYMDGARIYVAADLDTADPARAEFLAHGKLEIVHTAIIPAGAMLVVAPPEVAKTFRPLKVAKRGPLDPTPAPVVQVGPLRIPILVDVAQDMDCVLNQGDRRVVLPMIPAQAMVGLFVPELAHHVRELVRHTMTAIQQAKGNQPDGPALH